MLTTYRAAPSSMSNLAEQLLWHCFSQEPAQAPQVVSYWRMLLAKPYTTACIPQEPVQAPRVVSYR